MAMAKTKKKTYATHVTTPTGQRIYVSGRTRKELDDKVFQIRMEMRAGVDVKNDVLFSDYAKLWLRTYKEGKIRPSSYSILESQLRLHVLPFFDGMALKDIKPIMIQTYLNTLDGYSKSLQQKCLGLVRNILQSAKDNGLIVNSPVQKADKVTAENPPEEEPLTDEQATRLLSALKGTRAYTFCLIGLSTGMRRGEILGLMWEDIDFEGRIITVTHNKSFPSNGLDAPVTELLKTEAAHRRIPMSNLLSTHLSELREESSSDFVLCMENGASLSKSAFRSMWKAVDRRTVGKGRVPRASGEKYGAVNVTLDFDVHPHLLRHTFITKMFEAGLDIKQVQYLAGHSTPEMTMRVYTHYRAKQRATETHAQVCQALGFLSPAPTLGAASC